jgi:hypothetical protein
VPARARTASVVLAVALLGVVALLGPVPGATGHSHTARAVAVVSDHGAVLAVHAQRVAAPGHDNRGDRLPWAAPSALAVLALPALVAVLRRGTAAGLLLRASAGRPRTRAPPAAA